MVSATSTNYDFAGCCRLVQRTIRQNIADATLAARRGKSDEDNEALMWLWDHGRAWAEALEDYLVDLNKQHIANICEEISITADAARKGQEYKGPLLQRELKRRDKCHLISVR